MRPIPVQLLPFTYNKAGGQTYVEIDNRDVSARAGAAPGIEWDSLDMNGYLTRQSNQLTFSYKKLNGDLFLGAVNSNVKVYDSGTMLFQGVITKITYRQLSAQIMRVTVTAVDYNNELDGKLVQEQFVNQTCDYIIEYLLAKYAPQFTMDNVNAPTVIKNITFNLQPLSQCLQDMAGITGFDWYVDQYKDVHFNDATQTSKAPFSITDSNGTFEAGSMLFTDDISQLKNSIYIVGGNQVGDSTAVPRVGDGTTDTFPIGYHFSAKPTVTVGGVSKTVGTYGIDKAADFDCLWNSVQDSIIFPSAPAASAAIVITGTPLTPIRLYLPLQSSIDLYGERQLLVTDTSIVSFAGAIQRAQAELLTYAAKIVSCTFTTRTKGVSVGQYLNINSAQFGKNDTYIVTQVEATCFTPLKYEYKVTAISTRLFDIVDLLVKMLRQYAKVFNTPIAASFDPARWLTETTTAKDSTTANSHATEVPLETVTDTEATTLPGGTGLDFGTVFVFGPYVPSGTKRQFNFDRSPLG